MNSKVKSKSGRPPIHGMWESKEFAAWNQMLQRCSNPKSGSYSYYGGRGISVCERWSKFENFYADVGACPTGYSLDRFPNVDGNYEPGNVRWATSFQQARNKRNSWIAVIDGKEKHIKVLSEEYGIPYETLKWRMRQGWDSERLLKRKGDL